MQDMGVVILLHIELIGLPGAGKSTLKAGMIRKFKKKGKICLGVREAFFSSFSKSADDLVSQQLLKMFPSWMVGILLKRSFIGSRYRFLAQNRFISQRSESIEAILSSDSFHEMPQEGRVLALSRFLGTAIEYQVIKEQIGEDVPIVFDEGFFQRGTSLFIIPALEKYVASEESVFRYFDSVPTPNLLVLVETDLTKCAERMQTRGLPNRLAHLNPSLILPFILTCQQYFHHIIEWAQRRNKRVIRIVNNDLIESAVLELSGKMMECIKEQ